MIEDFRNRYGSAAGIRVFRAPGRVNLIGEHTDYNLGFVMPVALELACFVATAPAPEGSLRIFSEEQNELKLFPVGGIGRLRPARDWSDYIIGVAQELIHAGVPILPQNLLIRSTVPEGSGLSSSAALEVSSALALLGGREIDPLDLAKLCQRAEVTFVGMPCGIMDQYISVFGRANAAVKIDCRSLDSEPVTLPGEAAIVAVNSMVKHELASSAYKERTQECAAAVTGIRRHHPSVESLRDVNLDQFNAIANSLAPVLQRRARHVITENERVLAFVEACNLKDLQEMGRLFEESHRSLQRDYEVSCDELDFLVDTALSMGGVYGARMTGGGFGGCTVNLLRPGAVPQFRDAILEAYRQRFGVTPDIYPCQASEGAGEVKDFEKIPPRPALSG